MSRKNFLILSNTVFFVYMTITAILNDLGIMQNIMLFVSFVVSFALLVAGTVFYVYKDKDIILMLNIIQMVATEIIFGLIIGEYVCLLALVALITWFLGKFLGKESHSKSYNVFSSIIVFASSLIAASDLAINIPSGATEYYILELRYTALSVVLISICLLMLFKRLDLTLPNHIVMGLLVVYAVVKMVVDTVDSQTASIGLTLVVILCLGVFYYCMLFIPQGKKTVAKINKLYTQNIQFDISKNGTVNTRQKSQDNDSALSCKIAELKLLNGLKERQVISRETYEKEKQNIMEGK